MKILIPYDGSKNADIALDHLQTAEFTGQRHEILVVVTDVWLPETVEEFFSTRAFRKQQTEMSGSSSYAPALRTWEAERFLAREAHRRLELKFPSWVVSVTTLPGLSLVSSEILEKAESWSADLIILGSKSDAVAPGAQAVVSKARCPVRIARDSKVGNGKTASNSDFSERRAIVWEDPDNHAEIIQTVKYAAARHDLLA